MTIFEPSWIHFHPEQYEFTQPGWLWCIPAFFIIRVIFYILDNKISWVSESTPASLNNINDLGKNRYYHPLINIISTKHNENKNKSSLYLFQTLLFILLILALCQPVHIGAKLPDPPQNRDIVFIVDTSVSMILRDYELKGQRIDRMNLLKSVLDDFIYKLRGERMSIIVFGNSAYTLVPLTTDQKLLRNMLSRIQVTMAGRFNAMGDAIALAVKQAGVLTEKLKYKDKRKRVLVLMTDSDQPTGKITPEAAALLASHENLPLYTIAIGSTSLKETDDSKSGLLYSPVNLALLEKISALTGAKSYHAKNPLSLTQAIESIKTQETNKNPVESVYIREEYYHWVLLLTLLLFISAQLVNLSKFYLNQRSLR